MKFVAVMSVFSIPKYLLKLLLTLIVCLALVIWAFNLTYLLAAVDPLEILINFWKYGLNETSILLILISVAISVYMVLRAYLQSIGQIVPIWPSVLTLILVCLNGLVLPIVLSLFGIIEFGGFTRVVTNVILLLSLALSVYSVVWAGNRLEPAVGAKAID